MIVQNPATTMLIIEKRTLEDKNLKQRNQNPFVKRLYRVKSIAEPLKVLIQFFLGVIIFCLLVLRVLHLAGLFKNSPIQIGPIACSDEISQFVFKTKALDIVGNALALSAGVELAYMLFTPGPDEAVRPVILGLAATILLLISGLPGITWQSGLGVLLLVVTMAVLFAVNKKYVDKEDN
jgi:hypothetical protein